MLEMFRIESRGGNRFLAVTGIVYAVTAFIVLVGFLVSSWGAESLIDRAFQLALAGTVVIGIAFVIVARTNLRRPQSRSSVPANGRTESQASESSFADRSSAASNSF